MAERYFRDAFEQAMIGMALVAPDGRWLAVNRAFCDLLGYRESELLAVPFRPVIHPDDRDADIEELDRLREDSTATYTIEKRYYRKDHREIWLQLSVALVRDDSAAPAYFITQAQDITDRKLAEAIQVEASAQLARSNRQLQEFASVAAHDLQEPLRKIQAFGDRLLVKHGAALGPTGSDYLARMRDAAARMQRLINDLLSLSRASAAARPFEPVALETVAREVLRDLETRLAETGGRVEVGELPTIEADPLQMRQLLQNLLGNALKFHRPGHPPTVRLWSRRATTGPFLARPGCEILVEDDGIGFDAQYSERIFGVFQRLHERGAYEGSGIGLAICRTIVERHGGRISATSEPGVGTTFIITLPLTQSVPR